MSPTIPPNRYKLKSVDEPPREASDSPSPAERTNSPLDYLSASLTITAMAGLTIAMASRGRAARVRQDLMDRGLANKKPKLPKEQIKKRKSKRKRKR